MEIADGMIVDIVCLGFLIFHGEMEE